MDLPLNCDIKFAMLRFKKSQHRPALFTGNNLLLLVKKIIAVFNISETKKQNLDGDAT